MMLLLYLVFDFLAVLLLLSFIAFVLPLLILKIINLFNCCFCFLVVVVFIVHTFGRKMGIGSVYAGYVRHNQIFGVPPLFFLNVKKKNTEAAIRVYIKCCVMIIWICSNGPLWAFSSFCHKAPKSNDRRRCD